MLQSLAHLRHERKVSAEDLHQQADDDPESYGKVEKTDQMREKPDARHEHGDQRRDGDEWGRRGQVDDEKSPIRLGDVDGNVENVQDGQRGRDETKHTGHRESHDEGARHLAKEFFRVGRLVVGAVQQRIRQQHQKRVQELHSEVVLWKGVEIAGTYFAS